MAAKIKLARSLWNPHIEVTGSASGSRLETSR
jgi:hypothetical protein